MTVWSLAALLVAGFVLGPYGLNLLTPSLLQLLDPVVAMALAMVGVFIGLRVDSPSHIDVTVAIVATGGLVMATLRNSDPVSVALMMLALVVIAVVVAFAGSLLVAESDSERERQVFVVGSLLLLGGAAAYLSLSALFAGLLAGIVWNARGDRSKASFVRELDYFQHPFVVLLLLAAGASVTMSLEMLALAAMVVALDLVSRPLPDRFPTSVGLVAVAFSFDAFRGAFG